MEELKTNRHISSKYLAEGLEVSRRTVMRDIQVLKDAGYNIGSNRKGYHLDNRDKMSFSLSLSGEEKFTMMAGLQMLFDTKDPSLQIISSRLIAKLFGSDMDSLVPGFLRVSSGADNMSKLVRRIRAAVDNRKVIRFRYLKPGKHDRERVREVNPLAIFFRRHAYYMIARCCDRDVIRMFRISRIRDLIMTREVFADHNFNLGEFLEPAFELNASGPVGDVEIHFKPWVAPYIDELIWHPSQSLSWNEDGSVNLKMKVAINQEIVRWVLGFGSECVVISPDILINMLRKHVKLLQQYYST